MRDPHSDFHQVYKQYGTAIWSMIRRLGVSRADTDDVAQKVWITAHCRFAELDLRKPLPWLAVVARNHIMHLRRAGLRVETKHHALRAIVPDEDDQPHNRSDARWILQPALDALPGKQREVFLLCEADGFTAPEAAKLLGIPVDTVSSRLRKARQRLQAILTTLGPTSWALLLQHRSAALNPSPQALDQLADALAALPPPRPQVSHATANFPAASTDESENASEPSSVVAVQDGPPHFLRPASKGPAMLIASSTATAALALGLTTWTATVEPVERVRVPTPAPSDDPATLPPIDPVPLPPSPRLITADPTPPKTRRNTVARRAPKPPQAEPERRHRGPMSIKDSLTLITDAKVAAAAGDRSTARRILSEHEREYPNGPGADPRDRLLLRINCEDRNVQRAQAIAARHAGDPTFPTPEHPCKSDLPEDTRP